MIALYQYLETVIRRLGPVTVIPEKTRIAFQVRMSFAAVTLKRRWIDGHVVLARRLEASRFRRIESISARNHVHSFRLACMDDIDQEVVAWLAEAYLVGEQRHLEREVSNPIAKALILTHILQTIFAQAPGKATHIAEVNRTSAL
jgi:hypothetical protein